MVLEKIHKENDIKNLSPEELTMLADEIRQFLIEKISVTGGHLASNLGVVELTMALHLVFDLPQDKLIWDVGHQAYTHKLLTGRKAGFDELRKYGGMSGFPKRKESECDAFDTGHSSTSISAGLGYVAARELQGGSHSVVSIIGDGSMTGGMAYEALNNASRLKSNFIIVLNDNNMSISENVGGMSQYLNGLRTAQAYTGLKKGVEDTLKKIPGKGDRIICHMKRTKSGIKQLFVPGMFFEDMGITYLGPVDGHDIRQITRQSLRTSYGMVLQETWLRSASIRDNIAYGRPDAAEEEVIAAAKKAHAHSFIMRMPKGYDTLITEGGGNLSQGQKQLLCIARIMLCLPPMLILDEATSSIDTMTEIRIQRAFETLMQGRTSFVVAHRLSTVQTADLILVMNQGHIIEQGTHEELLAKKGFYYDLYNSQFAVEG